MPKHLLPLASLIAVAMIAPRSAHADGMSGELRAAATLGLTDSVGWAGQDDGTKAALGFALRGSLAVERGAHTWESDLDVEAAVGKARGEADLAKARDAISLESQWCWRAVPWFGTLVTAGIEGSPLGSDLAHEAFTAHSIHRADGRHDLVGARTLRLTDPGAPLRLRQEVGPVLIPVEVAPARVTIHLGVAARETFADGQLAVSDNPTTPIVELDELESAARVGVGGGLELRGAVGAARVQYRVAAGALAPLAHRTLAPGDERGAYGLTDVDLRAEISFRLLSWASLDYACQALREPLVLDDFRLRSFLYLSVGPTISFSSAR